MKTILALALLSVASGIAAAQPATDNCTNPCAIHPSPPPAPAPAPAPAPMPTYMQPGAPAVTAPQPEIGFAAPNSQPVGAPTATAAENEEDDTGWHKPVGRRFFHGFRLGWTYIANYDKPTRDNNMSLKDEFGLKSPNMMLLGYEGFYRIVGHSWLNVLMVGNVTVAGLEQSKFIPAASGLIGFEFDRSFQLGVGVNLTPDPQAPSHMIAAAGWTPMVGSIQTPVHFFYVPDAAHNSRVGATVGMNW